MFTPDQERIFNGLKEIGEEISNFFTDAVRLTAEDCTIASKANLIAHLAREIDGGLRDIFAPDLIKKQRQKEIKGIENTGHFASILAALGRDKEDKLANEWYDIATKFAEIAHRHGPWKGIKVSDEIIQLWNRYEKVLLSLVGSFYGIIDRIDNIIQLEEPTQEILGFLSNILTNPKYEWYFFINLKKVKWIKFLKAAGYFDTQNAPLKESNNLYPNEWVPIRFILNVAKQKEKETEKEIIELYKYLCEEYLASKFELHHYTLTTFAEILIELESYSFSEVDKKVFEKFGSANRNVDWNLHDVTLVEKLPNIYIERKDKDSIKSLLNYCFGFNVYYHNDAVLISDLGFAPFPQINYFLKGYHIKLFVDTFNKGIISVLGIEGIRQVEGIIKEICKIDSFKFSSSAIPSIETTDQSRYSHEWERSVIDFIVNGIAELSPQETYAIISEYIHSEVEIIRRISYHFIREQYDTFKNIFFDFIDNNVLNEKIPTHEPYVLLKKNSPKFSVEELERVIKWIESCEIKRFSNEESEEQIEKYKYYSIRKWLSSLEPLKDEQKSILFAKKEYYDSLNKTTISNPEFDSYSTWSVGPDYPLSIEDFESKSLDEQVEYINNFKPKDHEFSAEEGLGEILRATIIRNPSNYLFNLDVFLETKCLYLQNVLEAFTELLKKDKIAEFNLLVDFLVKKIKHKTFESENGKEVSNKKWFVNRVGVFIESLAKMDELYDFTQNDLIQLANFIIELLGNNDFKDCDDKIQHDYVTHILNSTQGRLHMGLIEITNLWTRKYVKPEDKIKWPMNVKNYFTNRLNRETQCDKDFSFVLGFYFPNFIFFDKDWVIQNLNKVFPKENTIHFEYTLSCCLSSYSRKYKDVFEILKEASIVKSGMAIYNHDCGPLGSIMSYALMEYVLWGVELSSTKSTLGQIIEEKKLSHIEKLIEIVWKAKYIVNENLCELWDKLLEIVSTEPEKYKIALKNLSWFIDCLTELKDEYTQKLLYSVKAFDMNDRDGYSLLLGIYKLVDTNLRNAGILILETFKAANITPFHDRQMYILVEKLFEEGINDIANEICLYVGEKGQLTLKDLYNKYNS
jgi:hypothetical protein